MRKITILIFVLYNYYTVLAQSTDRDKAALDNIQKSSAKGACTCIDSILARNKTPAQVSEEVKSCINKQLKGNISAMTLLKAFSAAYKSMEHPEDSTNDKAVPIYAPTKDEIKQYYYDIERKLYFNCREIRHKIKAGEIENRFEVGDNPQSSTFYMLAQDEITSGHYQESIDYCLKAITIDPNFAFAWNSIALNYNKLGEYNKTVSACNESIKIDPFSMRPHYMKASAYREMKQYENAVEAYRALGEIYPDKPDPFYELGKLYYEVLHDAEKGLDNLCNAYYLYTYDSPPIKSDIEATIRLIYSEMKKAGKEELFDTIRKAHKVPSSIKP